MLTRIIFIACMIVLWFFTQWLIGSRGLPNNGIQDKIHIWTRGWNEKLNASPRVVRILLISSSFVIDCLGIYMIAFGIFGSSVAPFLGLVLIFSLRQLSQYLTALPSPAGMIWANPGFPSLFVTYGVSNDLFFSGHTAIAVYGGLQLIHLGTPLFIALGIFVAVFEIVTVLVLRAHWTMDVFAGAVTALMIDFFMRDIGPWLDGLIM